VIQQFLSIPAGPDAELETASAEVINAGDLFGRNDRISLSDQADTAADPQPTGRRYGGGDGNE
jgi:hypothetical protein